MFFLFFLAIIVLAMIGLGSAVGTGLAGLGALILLPILLLKVMFIVMLFGFFGRRFSGRRPPRDWDGPRWRGWAPPRSEQPSTTPEERFDEWHRISHARDEVDGWVPDLGDTTPE